MIDIKDLVKLFFVFLKISLLTFGGGYTCLPIMEKELVNKNQLITNEELLSSYAIAQMMPGLIAVNVGVLIGYKKYKLPGALVIMLGTVFPPLVIGILIAFTFNSYSKTDVASKFFWGIRIGVCVLILNVIIKLLKETQIKEAEKTKNKNFKSIFFVCLTFILYYIFNISPIYIMVLAVLLSVLIVKYYLKN